MVAALAVDGSDPDGRAIMTDPQTVASLLAEIRSRTAAIEAQNRRDRELMDARRQSRAEREKTLAKQRRDGELGRDWQVLQQRIDMNQTTLSDIFTGVDRSEEARAVRRHVEQNLVPRITVQFNEVLKSDDVAGDLASLETARRELAETIARVRQPEATS